MIDINSGSGNKGIEDNAENPLSGTFYGVFPTGDGRPGGDFQAWVTTFHNIVRPLQPIPAGFVPPSAATDPPAGTTALGHIHHKVHRPATVTHASRLAKVAHPVTKLVNQSVSNPHQFVYDRALEALVIEVDHRARRANA